MNPLVLLAAVAVVFGILPLILRSNVVAMFMSLFVGQALSLLLAQELTNMVYGMVRVDAPVYMIVQIALLLIAPIVLLIVTIKSVGVASIVTQILPAIALVVMASVYIAAMLPLEQKELVENSQYFVQAKPYLGVLVGGALVSSVVYITTSRPWSSGHSKKKHH